MVRKIVLASACMALLNACAYPLPIRHMPRQADIVGQPSEAAASSDGLGKGSTAATSTPTAASGAARFVKGQSRNWASKGATAGFVTLLGSGQHTPGMVDVCTMPGPITYLPAIPPAQWAVQSRGGQGGARCPNHALVKLSLYAMAYTEQANDRALHGMKSADVSATGGAIAAAGGLAKSPQTSIVGLLIGMGGDTAGGRYPTRIQETNFRVAAKAMRCLYEVALSEEDPAQLLETEALDRRRLAALNFQMDNVVEKLTKAQSDITVGAVDTEKVRAAVESQLNAMRGVVEGQDKAKKMMGQQGFSTSLEFAETQQKIEGNALEAFKAKLTTCTGF